MWGFVRIMKLSEMQLTIREVDQRHHFDFIFNYFLKIEVLINFNIIGGTKCKSVDEE